MKFLDQSKIYVRSGAGGDGCLSFRREKYVEFGGPDGGDGGRGGHVWARATPGLNTLIDYRYRQHVRADRGGGGMGKNRSGASGDDVTIDVPIGTQIFEEDGESLIADLIEEDACVLLAKGGDGGLGNARFKSSTNQAPRRTTTGGVAEERTLILRLKLLADIGLVGAPNAGKSSFLSAVSAARPKVADYPFTTLYPQLGVVSLGPGESFVAADIPGLIKGAHEGVGLGDRFLGHIERCAAVLHLVDLTAGDPVKTYREIRAELAAYEGGLGEKSEVIALTKSDALRTEDIAEAKSTFEQQVGASPHVISSHAGHGVTSLLRELFQNVVGRKKADAAPVNSGAKGAASWTP